MNFLKEPGGWEKVKLNEICQVVRGSSPRPKGDPSYYGGPIPRLMVEDLTRDGRVVTPKIDTLTQEGAKLSRPVPGGTVVMVVSGDVGRVAKLAVDACIHDGFVGLLNLDTNRVLPDFLVFCLQFLKKTHTRNTAGAIWQNLTTGYIKSIQIPLPPLDEQKRIAVILSKADRLRRLRRYAHELNDGYLQSVFLEMFGDPVSNPMGWKTSLFGKVATIKRGRFSPRPRNDPRYYGGEYPFIQTGDIAKSDGYLRHYTQTLNEEGIRVSRAFDVNTVVIAIVGATIGETAILGIRTYCPDSVIGIQVDTKSGTPEYIEYMLRFWKPIFRAMAPETARANINLETLRPLAISLPPLPLQQKFTQIVLKIERLRAQQREAERQAEHLFQSLLHRAFRGELV